MSGISIVVSSILLILAGYQLSLSLLFWMRNQISTLNDSDVQWPRVSVLLALRGADPELALGLKQLFQQNYSNYELKIVVDCEADPAWKVVHDIISETGAANVHVEPLAKRTNHNSLHCASLVQLAEGLSEESEVFVLVDGDVVSHSGFIKELVKSIADGTSSTSSGNRWYMPPEGQVGSLVRYSWNAAAMVSMYCNQIPWGGMFAAKTDDLKTSGVIERWRRALAVDAPIFNCWRKIGGSRQFVPSLIIVNREECSIPSCFTFIVRQLLWTRLYQPAFFWWAIVIHALVSMMSMFIAIGIMINSLIHSQWTPFLWTASGLASYGLASVLSLFLLETTVRRFSKHRGEFVSWIRPWVLVKLAVAIPLTQLVHGAAVTKVLFLKSITWRGVTYRIRAPFDVELLEDQQPFHDQDVPTHSRNSL